MTGYTPDHAGMRELLNSDMLMDTVNMVADTIKGVAVSMSPVGSPSEPDEHSGLYISSWHTRSHRYGGATHDRVQAIVYNDSPDALWVEYGHRGREPYHVLRRAAFLARIA